MLAPGHLIDNKYRVGRVIGRGGMGAVYEAEAIYLHRRVAIKVQNPPSAAEAEMSGEMAARFHLEAQAAGRIGSRHIVDVIDLGRLESGEHFMVMEYLDGQSLRDRIAARGALSSEETLAIARQLLVGVSAAHAAGIIHRDLKPENVFLVRQADGSDFIKILDFGISKFNDLRASKGLSLTRTGALMGTPRYLSPEQAAGAKLIDHRTDIYMVGVILYECVTGVVPYSAESFNELLFRIVQEEPPPIRDRIPSANPSFVALIECAMRKDPGLRFQTAEAMSAAIEACARGEAWSLSAGPASGAMDSGLPRSVPPAGNMAVDSSRRVGSASGAPLSGGPPASLQPPFGSESAARSWSKSGGASLGPHAAPAPARGKLPWIGALVMVLLAAGAFAAVITRSRSPGPAAVAASASDAQLAPATAPSVAGPSAAPIVEPVASALPTASAAPLATARSRVTTRRSASTARVASPAAESAVVAPPATKPPERARPAATATAEDVSRMRGGRAIRGDL